MKFNIVKRAKNFIKPNNRAILERKYEDAFIKYFCESR